MHMIERMRRAVSHARPRCRSARDIGNAKARPDRRIGKRGVSASAAIGAVTTIACAGLVPAPALAQGFQMFGHGVDIDGLVRTEVIDAGLGKGEAKTAAGSLRLRVRAGALMAKDNGECSVNGIPTEVGVVFVTSGTYSRSFACDPERGGTESQGGEVRRTAGIKTTTSVAGNVVTLHATVALTEKVALNATTAERHTAWATRMTQDFALRLRIDGRNCTVLAYSGQAQKIIDKTSSAGNPNKFTVTSRTAMGPSTACRLVD